MIKTRDYMFVAICLVFFLLFAGCQETEEEEDTSVANRSSSAAKTSEIAPGSECEYGGIRVDTGIDENGNGTLDDSEIDNTKYVCNGADGRDGTDSNDGTDGSDGTKALVDITKEIPSHNCSFGGISIKSGLDADGDDVLDTDEVDSLNYLCNTDALYPIMVGEVGPISRQNRFQYPFACRTETAGLGQPEIDNQDTIGIPVFEISGDTKTDTVLGYSKNCGVSMTVSYFYKDASAGQYGTLTPLDTDDPPEGSEIADIVIDGNTHKYIVRLEQGTINRFVYAIGMIAPNDYDLDTPDLSAWNKKLIFYFGGGVGIGHNQGSGYAMRHVGSTDDSYDNYGSGGALNQPILEQGYAIISSSGTVTDTTYNLLLMGETAEMVKNQFKTKYGTPKYTFGIGGSGGAIQQFIYEQNVPDLLDGLVPTHVYPDMITQTIPVGDCSLIEGYFDLYSEDLTWWDTWVKRELIEGMHGIDGFTGGMFDDMGGKPPWATAVGNGSSECYEGWFGLTPFTMNPLFVDGSQFGPIWEYEPTAGLATKWTYYDDLAHIFGTDPDYSEYANQTVDNVGVQYGLAALVAGDISADAFLDINAKIGGWKKPWDMVTAGCPFAADCDPAEMATWDPWSTRNATANDTQSIKPRAEGSIAAINAAYRSGLVFLGDIDDPIINIWPYLEAELDMHNSRQSFSVRQRMLDADGTADNHVIWALDNTTDSATAEAVFMGTVLTAFEVLENWLDSGTKPGEAVDSCFESDGSPIASGTSVWDGITTDATDDNGTCADLAQFKIYKSSRIVAGEGISGLTFKCTLQTIDEAKTAGIYGAVSFDATQDTRLREIFPDGVCDYTQPDQGRPLNL